MYIILKLWVLIIQLLNAPQVQIFLRNPPGIKSHWVHESDIEKGWGWDSASSEFGRMDTP